MADEKSLIEIGVSGLRRQGGVIYEEYLRELQGTRWQHVIKQMVTDPVIGAVLFAIEMVVRRVDWSIQAGGDSSEDVATAEFVEECRLDMSASWSDTLAEILSFLPWGWAYLEIVYKRRAGDSEDATSKYTDGRIGWRKFAIRSQDTLDRWDFDDMGGVRGMWQLDPYSGKAPVLIPIEKALLFRTTSRKNSPEGVSIFRSSYECFDPVTELLTERGWVPVGEIQTTDRVLTLASDGIMEYQQPTALHTYDYSGDMLHVHGHFLDQMVTPNHNLYVRPAHKQTFEFKEARDVCKTVYFKRDGKWSAPDIEEYVIPEWKDGTGRLWPALTVPMDDWLNVLGIYVAEGSCTFYKNEDRQQRQVDICQYEGDKADVIRGWLSKMPFHVNENQRGEKINFRILRGQIYNELVTLGKARTKRVPDYVTQCSSRQINRFLMAFQLGDGSRANDSIVLYTSSRELADDLQELALKAGYVTTIRWQKSTGFGKGTAGAGVFKLVLAQSAVGGYRAHSSEKVPYNGQVFCVTVPNHTVYARRNGKACWSGNSWYFRRNIARIEAIGIERDLAGFPVFKIPGSIIVAGGAIYDEWKNVALNMRRDEQEALILASDVDAEAKTPLYDVKLLSTGGSRQFDTNAIVARYDQRIMASCLADFLLLGTKTGSYALSADKTDLFETALNTWCDSIAGVINSYAIPRLLRLNGIKTDNPPQLKAAPLEHVDLGILGTYINNLAGAGLPLFPTADGKLESELIEKGGLSAPAPEAFVEQAALQAAADEQAKADMQSQLNQNQNPGEVNQ